MGLSAWPGGPECGVDAATSPSTTALDLSRLGHMCRRGGSLARFGHPGSALVVVGPVGESLSLTIAVGEVAGEMLGEALQR